MNEKIYSKGYLLKIITWENDADNYKTQTIDGLTKEDAELCIAVAKQFKSTNSSDGLGNEEHSDDELNDLIKVIILNHPNISERIISQINDDIFDFIHMLLGTPVEYEWDFCRVYEYHKLFYVKEDIFLDLIEN